MKYTFLFLIFSNFLIAQESAPFSAQVVYDYVIELDGPATRYQRNVFLTSNNDESLFEIDHLNVKKNTGHEYATDNGTVFQIKGTENEFIFKDLKKNEIYFTNRISMKNFDIKERLDSLNHWQLTQNTKEILGYACQEAITKYGGRTYNAYFTKEIPIQNGPWRFQGLPGLILEVNSVDNVFMIKATSMSLNQKDIILKNPYIDKKTISWVEFLKIYRNKYDEVLRNGMTQYGPTASLPKGGIIKYIEE
jgi:GLPGLI family protein